MPGVFEEANRAVVEAAYYKITPTVITTGTTVPTLASDGAAVSSSRGILGVKPAAGETCDIEVYVYIGDEWWQVTEAAKTDLAGDTLGDVVKFNIGGVDRIYVRTLNLSGGSVSAKFFQARV